MKRGFLTGIDLVEVDRFKNFDEHGRFAKNIFTKKELLECKKKPNPAASLAARFAAKEAVVKCIGAIRYNLIEINSTKSGRTEIRLLDRMLSKRYNLSISLSHTEQFAIAVCVAWRAD